MSRLTREELDAARESFSHWNDVNADNAATAASMREVIKAFGVADVYELVPLLLDEIEASWRDVELLREELEEARKLRDVP